MTRIITVTVNPAVDKSTRVERVEPDRKLRGEQPRFDAGGGGLNVSRALLRLGESSQAITVVGGPTGEILEYLLREDGVDVRALPTEAWTRENLMVMESAAGDRQYRFGLPGPELSEEEWQSVLDTVADELDDDGDPENTRYVVASGSLPPGVPGDFYARVGDVARKAGASLVLDTSGEALNRALEAGVFLVKPNLRELMEATGHSLDELDKGEEPSGAHERAARDLIEGGAAEVVLVSMGSAGALCVTARGSEHIPAPTVSIQSKVGAGDSTVAGIVRGLARGWALEDAVRYGVAAGAAAVTTPGTELLEADTVEKLFSRMGGR
jgi:6-phosphofructokinase 2